MFLQGDAMKKIIAHLHTVGGIAHENFILNSLFGIRIS
jgi:hypothetical protein